VLFLAIVASACSDDKSPTAPTPPTPPPPAGATVTSVVIASTQMNPMTYQLRADAQMSDGTTKDVTTAAQWQTSNTAVAQVSPSGLVTVVHDGTVEIRATYQSVTGTTNLTVAIPLFTVRGTVTAGGAPQEGVRITINSGLNQGEFTYTDDRGIFNFDGLRADTADFAIAHAGYQPWTQRITIDKDITDLAVVLMPVTTLSLSQ
jgi:hypothetical protein